MEAVKEPPLLDPAMDGLKISVTCDKTAEASKEADVCHKPNGVAEPESKEAAALETVTTIKKDIKVESEITQNENSKIVDAALLEDNTGLPAASTSEPDTTSVPLVDSTAEEENLLSIPEPTVVVEENINHEEIIENSSDSKDLTIEESVVEVETANDSIADRVFQTEILIESNDNETIETMRDNTQIEKHDTNNILSELGESIEFSEALRSSDVTDNVENNNCAGRQEIFNNEELLDILEGNNDGQMGIHPNLREGKILETQLALQQLTRLKKKPKKLKSIDRVCRRRSEKVILKHDAKQNMTSETNSDITEVKLEESIVKDLVKDWDDDEDHDEKSVKLLEESEKLMKSCDGIVNQVKNKAEEHSNRMSTDSQPVDGKMSSRNADDSQPQRRLGRVIKKKVIFDPDNPDTFTKSKVLIKNKEHDQEKEQTPSKKIKVDPNQRSKSKSPLSKLQWKKPSPKNIKQNKRLTEVDKLLMDEGAVNMIYQLTPEAPKGKKNMKTKAEFIKKIQSSSTPDTKEMKFRERKKESKFEEGEARRLGGKQRPSLNSSVKSPSVSEDFEAHSADDSIIYRRHSSSSYSSSCMSPRRLSDVEMTTQTSRNPQQLAEAQNPATNDKKKSSPVMDNVTFMSDSAEVITTDTINKDDCLSIKEKLKSKLNIALNKRKHENTKTDKPSKLKKVTKVQENMCGKDFKYLSIKFDGKLAALYVQKPGSVSNVEIIKELECALKLIESKKEVSITLLMPECGVTFSDLDLRSLLDEDVEKRSRSAYGIAEAIRSLLHTVEQHSKLLCTGVSNRCTGIGLALVGLSDVTLASERASFAISPKSHGLVEPGISVLTSYHNLHQSTLSELIVFGRRLSATEALHNGLVSRVLWPEKFNEQVLNIVKDIAVQPAHNIWLKKEMLTLKKKGGDSTFLTCLEKERDLFIQYWASEEGQDLLRTIHTMPTNP